MHMSPDHPLCSASAATATHSYSGGGSPRMTMQKRMRSGLLMWPEPAGVKENVSLLIKPLINTTIPILSGR